MKEWYIHTKFVTIAQMCTLHSILIKVEYTKQGRSGALKATGKILTGPAHHRPSTIFRLIYKGGSRGVPMPGLRYNLS